MNRVIKFRAFLDVDDDRRGVYMVRELLEPGRHTPNGSVRLDRKVNPSDDGEVDRALVILSQFTGLQDKNGKEIYEGDVVNFKPLDKASRMNGLVKYDDSYAAFYFETNAAHWYGKPSPSQLECHFPNGDHEYEIIGSIHENPELLESDEVERG